MRIEVAATLRDAASLFWRNILWLYVDFFAAAVMALTLYLVFFPMQAIDVIFYGVVPSGIFYIVNPYSILSSLTFAFVTVGVTKRLWRRAGMTAPPGPFGLQSWIPIFVLALLIDHLLFPALLLFLIPGLFLSALTTVLTPVLVLEQRGWQAPPRAIELVAAHISPLMMIWAVILVPWVFLMFAGSSGPPESGATITLGALWWREVLDSMHWPIFSAFATCIVVTVYKRLLEIEGGPSGEDLDNIFR